METSDRQSIFRTLRQIIGEQLDVREELIRPELTWERLGADSLDRLGMTAAIEETFAGVEIPHRVGEKLNTVGDTLDYLLSILAPMEAKSSEDPDPPPPVPVGNKHVLASIQS